MTTSHCATKPWETAVAMHYQVDGAFTALAVARGESKLIGVATASGNKPAQLISHNVGEFLAWQDAPSRLYYDAIFARTVERVFNLPTINVFDDSLIMREVLGLAVQSTLLPPPLLRNGPLHCASQSAKHANGCINFLRTAGLFEQYTSLHLPTVEPVVEMILDGFFDHSTVRELPIDDLEKQELLRRVIVEASASGVTLADEVHIRRQFLKKIDQAHLLVGGLTVCW